MYSLLFLGLCSFIASFLLTPLCRDLFQHWGILDQADNIRKIHTDPIPRVGGVPILLSYVASYGLLFAFPLKGGHAIYQNLPYVMQLLPAIGLIFLTGLLDDMMTLKPWQKLLGQLAASGLAWWAGVRILNVVGLTIENGWSLLLTVLWLLACSNAFNLIDGVDGLASGVGLFATLTILISGLLQQNAYLALATVPLFGALLAFLRYNFNPATIFLGDSGSLLIGFLLGCYAIIWGQKSATLLGMTAPVMVLAVPLLDVMLAIARRYLRHQPIFGADRGHIHHRLLDRGLTPRRVALLLYGVSGVCASLSLLSTVLRAQYFGIVVLLFTALVWIGIQNLNYVEFGIAGRMVLGGAFRRTLNAQLCLDQLRQSLQKCSTIEDLWTVLCGSARQFGFNQVELCLAGESRSAVVGNADPCSCWTVQIPISEFGYVNFSREFSSPVLPSVTTPFIDLLHISLEAKITEIRSATPNLYNLIGNEN